MGSCQLRRTPIHKAGKIDAHDAVFPQQPMYHAATYQREVTGELVPVVDRHGARGDLEPKRRIAHLAPCTEAGGRVSGSNRIERLPLQGAHRLGHLSSDLCDQMRSRPAPFACEVQIEEGHAGGEGYVLADEPFDCATDEWRVPLEGENGVGRDDGWCSTSSISKLRWSDDCSLGSLLHFDEALIPCWDDLADTNLAHKWFISLNGRVENFSIC